MTVKSTLALFGTFVGIAQEAVPALVDAFAQKNPKLITEDDPGAPPEAPTDDLDPSVRDTILAGKA